LASFTLFHYGVKLDAGGMIPGIRCRIVENPKKSEDSPDLVFFLTPADAGEEAKDLQVGALWRNGDYFLGRLTPPSASRSSAALAARWSTSAWCPRRSGSSSVL
jgi:hypothetical protein